MNSHLRKDKKQEQNQTQDKMEYKGLKYADFENQRAITNKSYKIKKKDETKSKISDEENKERTNFNINKNCSSRRIIKKNNIKSENFSINKNIKHEKTSKKKSTKKTQFIKLKKKKNL